MRTWVQKWGNSLGIRIPKALAQEVDVAADSEVEITVRDGKILVSPLRRKALSLRQLLSKVMDSNLHEEFESGGPVGKENW
ncbi:MAG TPA: AbrB/MazE/SpoVT family DNA-binding domain-containing protein [Spirochaetia bacterium]|nr:AbrB/MazE/SpoVT family DNA-binding domain-containing protein [Spirochaetia bacterium]